MTGPAGHHRAVDDAGPPPGWHGIGANPYNPHCLIIGEPRIDAGTWIGAFTLLDASGGLTIGAGCDIGIGVQIYTHSSARRCVSGRAYDKVDRAAVHIGDRVFLGPQSMVLPGVTIGDGAVILSGAIVTGDVPASTMMAGIPARPVGVVHLDGSSVTFEFSGPGTPAPSTGAAPAVGAPATVDVTPVPAAAIRRHLDIVDGPSR